MKRHRIYLIAGGSLALVLAVGLRVSTGQGYREPIVRPVASNGERKIAQRVLEVRLKNRNTGRPQHYEWHLAMPQGASVEIECHEWKQVRLFGVPMFGVPTNSFHRVISIDSGEEGASGPYDYFIQWRPKNA